MEEVVSCFMEMTSFFNSSIMLKFLKTYALFISMLIGIVFHNVFAPVSWMTQYLLFCMLLVTYCKVSITELKFERLHLSLAIVQFIGCILFFVLFSLIDDDLGKGALICMLMPTATSAPVITAILGGSIACLVTYSIVGNLSTAIIAPLAFSIVGVHGNLDADLSFFQTFLIITRKVLPLLFGPFLLAILLKSLLPKAHKVLQSKQIISFWMWSIALVLIMAKTTCDLINLDSSDRFKAFIMALISALVCVFQFLVGRRLGKRHSNTVAGGQALGQKNTILGIWMAQTFFNPIVVVAPASYVLWQNLINSFQLWKQRKATVD